MNEGILSAIGNTPLIRLSRIFKNLHFQLYAKLEALNPGGSVKDRAAFNIIQNAIMSGEIGPDTVVIESSSGNMGIGLAQACRCFDLRFICVVDPKATRQNIDILRAFGAEIDLVTEPDPDTGGYLKARLDRVKSLLGSIANSFWPDQYSNLNNCYAHHQTMREIAEALDGKVDYLICATSTCGTIRGCSEYIHNHNLSTKVVAVDAVGSIIFGGEKACRLLPGHGAAVRPALFNSDLADQVVLVTDFDCVVNCRRLVKREAILAGGSSGAVLSAIDRLRNRIPKGASCVAIFPDRGERYLDTIYSDFWVEKHFGDLLNGLPQDLVNS